MNQLDSVVLLLLPAQLQLKVLCCSQTRYHSLQSLLLSADRSTGTAIKTLGTSEAEIALHRAGSDSGINHS